MDKVAELAKILTVDANGNDATSPDFDPENVVQWGFHHQFNDDARASRHVLRLRQLRRRRRHGAQIPENWLASWQWYVDLIASGAAPNDSQIDSDTLAQTNAFSTGNVAMAFTHLWYTCCVRDEDGNGLDFWDIAVVPEYQGEATSKLHADTFRILESTENPEAAFEVLTYLLDDAAPVAARDLRRPAGPRRPARPVLRHARRAVPAGRRPGTSPSPASTGPTCRATRATCRTSTRRRR